MASKLSSPDAESTDWHNDKELFLSVDKFHRTYAMPPEKLKSVKPFHEYVLDDCFKYLGFCTDVRKIGGSYEGVKVVKSKDDDFEFDVMFVLKLPEDCHLEIVEIPERHGYAMLKVANGCSGTPDYYRATADHKFFAGCLTLENDTVIVDAGKSTAAFFGELQKWINTKPIPGFNFLPRQHGTAIQMDVLKELIGNNGHNFFYSVDIAPTFEIVEEGVAKRYVAKPVKKRTPDSVTWRRLFDSDQRESDLDEHARNILRASVEELDKQQGLRSIIESARTCKPLPEEYMLKLRASLVESKSRYRLTFINLQDLKKSTNERYVAISYSSDKELEVLSIPEKPGYAWLKPRETDSSRVNNALKLCYLPGGKYLDHKAASDLLVAELRSIAKDLFNDKDTVVRREGPIVRIDVYPEKGNVMLYYYLDIVLAAYVDSNFYVGFEHNYDEVPDKRAWRRSYSYEETIEIQQAPEGLKSIFRVLKALRNGECGLAQLTSYHFKTLLLNMHRLKNVDWNENIDKLFIRALKNLKSCLSEKELKTHFNPEINLFENVINDCIAHMHNRIDELLRNKRKMFKALKNPMKETTDDVLKQHKSGPAKVYIESAFVRGFVCGPSEPHIVVEIEKQLFGYDHSSLTRKYVYDDISVFRICNNEVEGLTNINAMMFIHNNKKSLRACQYNPRVTRLERCNSTVSTSFLQTVTHNSGLADTKKTAEYIKQQMEKLVSKSSLLHANLSVQLVGSIIVVKLNSNPQFNILPGYEVGEGFFICMPEVPGTNSWTSITFTPIRNKFWKAFGITECGRRVLNELRNVCNRERSLVQLSERQLRMAVFSEMEVERDWSNDKVTERLPDVLRRLLICIKEKNLPDYFDPTRNTLL